MGYKLSWTLVSSATSYKLQYSVDGGDYIDLTTTTNNYYDLSGMSAGGDYVLSVISQATGYTDSDRATIEYKPRAVSYTLTNCSASLQKTVTQYGATFPSFSISPASGYNFGTGATYSVYNGTTPVTLTVSDGIIAVPSFIVGGAVTVNVSAASINYSVTNTLTNCTSNNSATSVSHGASYSATLTAASGYTLTGATASVKMGGVDITSTAYSAGVITISSVTGAIAITVSAISSGPGLSGVWIFETCVLDSISAMSQTVNFASNGRNYAKMTMWKSNWWYLKYIINDDNYTIVYDADRSWLNEAYRTVDFGSTPQTVSQAFYTWFTANAVKQS